MNFGVLLERSIATLRGGVLKAILNAFMLKFGTVGLNLLLVVLAARAFDAHEFGTYSMLFSAAGLLAILAIGGHQLLMMSNWAEYLAAGDWPRLKGALIFAGGGFALSMLSVALLLGLVLNTLVGPVLALATVAYMLGLAISLFTTHLVRVAVGVNWADGLGNYPMLLVPIAYVLSGLMLGTHTDIAMVLLLLGAGASVAIVIHLLLIARAVRRLVSDWGSVAPRFEVSTWSRRALHFWLSSSLEATNQFLDVILIGLLMSPGMAGAYFVVTRVANGFATVSSAIYIFAMRYLPDLYYRREFAQLDRLLNSIAMVTLAFLLAGIAVVALFGQPVLSLISADYADFYPELLMLCLGTAAVTAAGPVMSLLMLSGHERSYFYLLAASVSFRVLAFALLVPTFQLDGAVIAATVSLVGLAIAMATTTRRKSGIDGSVLRLLAFGRQSSRPVS